jgi:coenzyme F420-reducing hydrogenase delta subunit
VNHIRDLLKEIGINPRRVQMFNMSAAMAGEFVEKTEEMTELIAEIGMNPMKE